MQKSYERKICMFIKFFWLNWLAQFAYGIAMKEIPGHH